MNLLSKHAAPNPFRFPKRGAILFSALVALLAFGCGNNNGNGNDGTGDQDTRSGDVGTIPDGGGLDSRFEPDAPTDCNTLGCVCEEDEECASGYCLEVGGSGLRLCSEFCVDECSLEGFDCRLLENSGGDAVRLCVPEDDPYCEPCDTPTDCGSLRALCMPLDNLESACLTPCDEEDATCPSGADCRLVEHQDVAGLFCVPRGGVCEPCIDEDEDGRGIGADCLGGDPDDEDPTVYDGAPELCDGVDNDGDLNVDEDFDLETDPANCGECGIVCEAPHATAECSGGICRIAECEEGWADCDAVYENGCEQDLAIASCEDLLVPPTVEILSPEDGQVFAAAEEIVLRGLAIDATDAAETLLVRWTSSFDEELYDGSPDTEGVTEWSGTLSPGLHTITLSATDSDARVSEATIDIRINTAPDAPTLNVIPEAPLTGDELFAELTGPTTDSDGDELTFTFEWFADDALIEGAITNRVPAVNTSYEETWRVRVTAHDGFSSSESAEDEVTIGNTPPSAEVVTIEPSVPHLGATVECTYDGFNDADGHEDVTEIRWWLDDVMVAVGAEWVIADLERGADLRCIVTPWDGLDYGEPIEAVVRIGNAPPTVEAVAVSPNPAVLTDTLRCDYDFVDVDGDEDGSTVRWFVNDELVGVGPTLLGAFVRDDRVRCEVTPFDGDLSSDAVASEEIRIANALPVAETAVIDPTPAFEESELDCLATGSDPDGDEPAWAIRWSVNDLWVEPATDVLDGASFDRDSRVRCEATPVDGAVPEDLGEPLLSDELVIGNTPPTVEDVWIEPDPAVTLESLRCLYDGYDDVDGGADSSEVSFWIGDELIFDGSELVDGGFRGQVLRCRVIPHDGDDPGGPVWSDPFTIRNAPPTLDSLAFNPSPPTAASPITCDPGRASDPETDAVTLRYLWEVNGEPVGPFDPPNVLPVDLFERDDTIWCEATPNDGVLDGEPREVEASVGNALPRIVSVAIDPVPAFTETVVRAVVTVEDADDDPVSVELDWTVAGIIVADTLTLDGTVWFNRDQVIGLRATPSDDDDEGAAVFATEVRVSNTPPEAPGISITPDPPVEGEGPIICQVDTASFDLDPGDAATYSVTWEVDGEAFVGATTTTIPGDTVPAEALLPDEAWTCTVTPHDGTDPGTIATASVTVQRAVTRVFVTNEGISTNMPGLSGADAFCNTAAADAGLSGTWSAFLSTTGTSARNRIRTDRPFVRLDDAVIATDLDDLLDGGIAVPINIDENGAVAIRNVYTGSITDGTTGTNTWGNGLCKDWTQGCGVCEGNHWYAQSGLSNESGSRWVSWGWQFCGGGSSLYCFEN